MPEWITEQLSVRQELHDIGTPTLPSHQASAWQAGMVVPTRNGCGRCPTSAGYSLQLGAQCVKCRRPANQIKSLKDLFGNHGLDHTLASYLNLSEIHSLVNGFSQFLLAARTEIYQQTHYVLQQKRPNQARNHIFDSNSTFLTLAPRPLKKQSKHNVPLKQKHLGKAKLSFSRSLFLPSHAARNRPQSLLTGPPGPMACLKRK